MKEIDIFWIRHSVTYNNIYSLWEKILKYDRKKFRDPSIIPTAETGSCLLEKKMDKKIKNSRLVCCSQLNRAIQTSILMFPEKFKNKKIRILRGIREKAIGPENEVEKPEVLKDRLYLWCKSVMNNSECIKLKKLFDNDKILIECINSLFSDLNDKNFKKLKNNIAEEDEFMSCLKPYLEEKNVSRVVIVSHSNYIKNNILSKNIIRDNKDKLLKSGKLHNNQILNKKFNYHTSGEIKSIFQEIYHFGCTDEKNTCCFYNKKSYSECKKK